MHWFNRAKLRRYAVTVMDNWTPMREFWTFEGAKKFHQSHSSCAHLYQWHDGEWIEMPACNICRPAHS